MRAFFSLLSVLWRYATPRRAVLVLYASMFVVANIIWLFEPYMIGRILNDVQLATSASNPMRETFVSLLILVFLSVGFWVFHGPARLMERRMAFHVRAAFKQHLFSIVTNLPLQWHKDHHSGQTINRIGKATTALFRFTESGFQLIEMMIRPLGALLALTIILPGAAALSVGVLACSFGIVFLFDRVLLPIYDQINEKDHAVASVLHDYVTNITTVITLRLEALTQSELWKRMTHYEPIFRRENRINETKWFTATLLISLMTAVVLGWYVWTTLTSSSTLLAGTFFMLYDYLQKIGGAFYTFAWKYGEVVEQSADLRTVQPIVSQGQRAASARERLPADWKTLEVRHLRFSYPAEAGKKRIRLDASFTLTRGKKIAFVGESGSGKSTSLALIRGLLQAHSARITCDGAPLRHGLRTIAEHVTLLPQDPEIFANTIEYNITVDTKQSRRELLEDIELARFSSVVKGLPNGLRTDISEKGINLSGGEKQRLALARGIFAAKQSDIILLDEPTSSVDPGNERAIYEGIFRRFSDRCIVSSIHKTHLLPLFDYVYVFENGKVVREGKSSEVTQTQTPSHHSRS